MKAIKNESSQGFQIFINTGIEKKSVWLKPKQRILVEDSAITEQILVLSQRKILKITNA